MVPNGNVIWDDEVAAPALIIGDQWISYDDETSVAIKAQYAMDRGYGGTMVWATDNDDFQAVCGSKYPLMRTIYYTLEGESSPACHVSPTTTAVTWWPNPGATNPPAEIECWYPLAPGETTPDTPETTAKTTEAPCVGPDCDPCANNVGGLVADPTTCQCYYSCSNGEGREGCCSDGLIFNADKGYCDWPGNYQCGAPSPSTTEAPATTSAAPATTEEPDTQPPNSSSAAPTDPPTAPTTTAGNGGFCDGKPDGNHADPDDCTIFHMCSGGVDFIKACAPGLVYDNGICTWPTADNSC
jgi:hypothetical protein